MDLHLIVNMCAFASKQRRRRERLKISRDQLAAHIRKVTGGTITARTLRAFENCERSNVHALAFMIEAAIDDLERKAQTPEPSEENTPT